MGTTLQSPGGGKGQSQSRAVGRRMKGASGREVVVKKTLEGQRPLYG